jgi:hypothetical protein
MGSLRLGASHLLIVFAHSLSEVAIQGAKSNKNVCAPKCTGQRYDKKSALDLVALYAKNRQAIRMKNM